jgi:hypothetical protein
MAYLKSVDSDFAKAQPAEQRMYMAHIRQVLPQVGGTPDLGGMIKQNETQARVAGLPGGSPITAPATPMMANVAGGAIAAAGTGVAIPAALGFIRSHPIVGPMIASEAISKARQIPYVGKFIPPYSEMLPFLVGGKGERKIGGEPDATIDPNNVPEYAGEAPAAGSPEELRDFWKQRGGGQIDKPIDRQTMQRPTGGSNFTRPHPGSPLPESQMTMTPQAQIRAKLQLNPGQYEAPASPLPQQKQLGGQVLEGEYMQDAAPPPAQVRGQLKSGVYQQPGGFEPNQPALPQRGSAIQLPASTQGARQPISRTMNTAPEIQMQQKLGIQPQAEPASAAPSESQFPPNRPQYAGDTNTMRANLPWNKAARRAEMIDDHGVQQEMNANLEAHGASAHDEMVRDNYARMSTGATKGDLVRQAGGTLPPERPVKYTKTTAPKAKPAPPPKDLTAILQESVRQANLRKQAGAKR